MRPLLLQAASGSGWHHHAVHHGLGRLTDLRLRLKAVNAARQQALDAASAPPLTKETPAVPSSSARAGAAGPGRGGGKAGDRKGKPAPEASPTPAILQQQRVTSNKNPVSASSTTTTTGGSASEALQAANAALYRLAVDAVSTLKLVGLSMLHLGDGEAILGLEQWASRAFEPLFVLLQQQRGLQLLKQAQADAGSSRGMAASATAAAAGGAGPRTPDVDDDIELPFGPGAPKAAAVETTARKGSGIVPPSGIKTVSSSPSSSPRKPSGSAVASSPYQSSSSPLAWLRGVALQAQGRYEHAVRHYNAFLASESWSLLSSSPATASAVSGETSTPPPLIPSSAAVPSVRPGSDSSALASHISVRRFVVERAAECFASLTDWAGLHALASEHRALARADPSGHGTWWAPVAQQMHAHFATASYDLAPGPAAVDVKVRRGLLGGQDQSMW